MLEKIVQFIFTAVLWYFVLKYMFMVLVVGNYDSTIAEFEFLGIISLVIFIIMLLWQSYNIYMFGSKERRKSRGEATPEDVAARFNITLDKVQKLCSARYVNLKQMDNVSFYYSADSFEGEIVAKLDQEPLQYNRKQQNKVAQ